MRVIYKNTKQKIVSVFHVEILTFAIEILHINICYVPGLLVLFFSRYERLLVPFSDRNFLIRNVDPTSGIGEIIIFYKFYLFNRQKFLFKNLKTVGIYFYL